MITVTLRLIPYLERCWWSSVQQHWLLKLQNDKVYQITRSDDEMYITSIIFLAKSYITACTYKREAYKMCNRFSKCAKKPRRKQQVTRCREKVRLGTFQGFQHLE